MDNAGDVPKQRQDDVDPKLRPDTDLEKNTNWRKQYCENESNDIHEYPLLLF